MGKVTVQVERNEGVINGIPNLMSRLRKLSDASPTGEVWFRGVQDLEKHRLLPSIGRDHWFAGKSVTFDKNREAALLRRFQRFARQFSGRTLDEWEAMFLARHHGLPVRLMDWTANPLVALYMACEHNESDPPHGCMWVLVPRANTRLDVLSGTVSPFGVQGVKLVDPMIVSPRIGVQGGIFTIHGDPWNPLDEYEHIELTAKSTLR